MKRYFIAGIFCLAMPMIAMAQAEQEAMPEMSPEHMEMMQAWQAAATPGEAHARLAEQVGSWKAKVESWSVPGIEPTVNESTVERKISLDGRVIEEHWSGNMMGMTFVGHGRTGFDNVKAEYWSTWTDNMSTGVMMFTGNYDEANDRYEFTGSYVDPVTKETISTRNVSARPDSDQEMMEMYETRNGEEFMTMRITLTRQ
ncbi:MAG: DUF1579 family protein [Pseudomonadota bacterium]